MKIFNHTIEFNTRAKNTLTHLKLHKRPYYNHLCWWKFSLLYGQSHLEPITVCAHCYEEIQRVGCDSLDWCEGCQQIEGDTLELTTEEWEARQ